MKKLVIGWVLLALSALVARASAQAVASAGRAANLQVGAGGLYVLTDYAAHATQGVAAWSDFDFSQHLGLEGMFQFGGVRAPDEIAERSYSVGPRISFRRERWNLFGTVGFGQGTISNRRYRTASTFNLFNYGVGLEYTLTQRVNLRAGQVEREHWIGFPPHGLNPFSAVLGVSFILP